MHEERKAIADDIKEVLTPQAYLKRALNLQSLDPAQMALEFEEKPPLQNDTQEKPEGE